MTENGAVQTDPTTSTSTTAEKPAVLIIGGLGYMGRFLARYIHDNNLASEIRLVDKHLPELAWLAPEFKEACSRERFMQADASREQSLQRVFDRDHGKQFDYVFNCGGETRYSQEDEVYKMRSYGLSMAVGKEAAKRGVKCFVELSTGMIYKPDSIPRKETDKLKPWSKLAKWKLNSEDDLAKVEGLNLMVMRMAHVYGPYTSKFISTALCMARVYQFLNKEMKFLWKEDLRTNTVHVEDAVRAIWTGAEWYVKAPPPRRPVPIFNIVDHGNTSQGIMAKLMHETFNIDTGFHGTLISAFARLNLDHVVDEVNDETLDPWADLQTKAGISKSTPLSPFMEKELLKDTDLSLDGSAFERATGFQYEHPQLTKDEIEKVVASYRTMGWWP
ncbi:NAD dependent epimerase/dehydratase family protein-like protein [Lindgomyces ingoldianus]|uniref:NAD dependent epimerase/dehydratase family protein-like protein n=1 Tax=Lindgomyces ingoldianus TaxID=673940 RepID=A0ACB6QAV5_9PLEO|nr:NAD dependent epimerase/dehydratase family protein-like protein [Lindgomyces ingoldianus]KAF2464041.1 NAD dependent epimerase/dehydratase family protein-like protein [Lindgomyces ingoldianus]